MRDETSHTLVVAATDESADDTQAWYRDTVEPALHQRGMLTFPWRIRLLPDKMQALAAWPYLYFYSGVPTQALLYRLHVSDYRTTKDRHGLECPWPEFATGDYHDVTPKGETHTGRVRTWFLVDRVERLEPSISVNELVRASGAPASPYGLMSGYGLWRLR